MPQLDRRITVRRRTMGTDDFGRPIPPTNVDVPVWATRMDAGLERVLDEGGAIGTSRRVYRVRYRRDVLAAAKTAAATVLDDGEAFTILDVVTVADSGPLAERRRFMDLQVEGVTS